MQAIVIHSFGGQEQLMLETLPTPQPSVGEVLIRIKAAGVNPVDYKIRQGLLAQRLPHHFPLIPGWDAAGVVEKLGPGVTTLRTGDEVYAYCRKPVVQGGCYAEYVTVPATSVSLKPRNLSMEEAAAVPLAGLTAYQSLIISGKLKPGETVLIHAAAGGVGSYAVQLAKIFGARVIGTASRTNHEFVRQLGAAEVIDYTKEDFRLAVKKLCPQGVDMVFDGVGGTTLLQSPEVLKSGGRLVSILQADVIEQMKTQGVDARYVFVAPDGGQLEMLRHLIEEGSLKVHVSAVLPLAEAARAHERIETGHTQGKIVLTI